MLCSHNPERLVCTRHENARRENLLPVHILKYNSVSLFASHVIRDTRKFAAVPLVDWVCDGNRMADIYGDLPEIPQALVEQKKKKKKHKKKLGKGKKKLRQIVIPPPPEKGILKASTPISTKPDGTPLNSENASTTTTTTTNNVTEPSNSGSSDAENSTALSSTTSSSSSTSSDTVTSTAADAVPIVGPQMPTMSTAAAVTDTSKPTNDVELKKRQLEAEIARIKARLAAKHKAEAEAEASAHSGETTSVKPATVSTPVNRDSPATTNTPSRKRRVSFLMDQPKKHVKVDISSVLVRIEKFLLSDKKFGKACTLLRRLIEDGKNLNAVRLNFFDSIFLLSLVIALKTCCCPTHVKQQTNSDKFIPALRNAMSNRERIHSDWARPAVVEMMAALEKKVCFGYVVEIVSIFQHRLYWQDCWYPQVELFAPGKDKEQVKLWILDGSYSISQNEWTTHGW
mgnify:CR=1 FL=1